MIKASMGISQEDELILKQEVNIVFHLASSRVKGDEPIRYYIITQLLNYMTHSLSLIYCEYKERLFK